MEELWNGFVLQKGIFDGKNTIVVLPKEGTANGRLAVKTEYWGAFPKAVEIDLLKEGFHLCYIENDNRWGTDVDLDRKEKFIRFVREQYHLTGGVVPVGMSCGGLVAIKLSAKYPELIDCLYLDAPVLNYLSCPCGFGDATPLDEGKGVAEVLRALGMQSVSELIGYREMPLDKVSALADYKIPVVLVAGGDDHVVPYHENGIYLENAYRKSGLEILVSIKPECDHHPHGLVDNQEVITFILTHKKAIKLN